MLGRNIHLNNFVKEDKAAQLHGYTFDKWIDLFHHTMIIFNEQIRFFENVRRVYKETAKANGNKIQIRINRKDPVESTEYRFLKLTEFNENVWRWSWLSPEDDKQK